MIDMARENEDAMIDMARENEELERVLVEKDEVITKLQEEIKEFKVDFYFWLEK